MKKRRVITGIAAAIFLALLLALCTIFVLPRVLPREGKPGYNITRGDIACILVACKLFRLHCNRYPLESEGLNALVADPGVTNWQGPYLKRLPLDAWKTPYHYSIVSNAPHVASAGADRTLGTPDDITD